VVRVNEDQEGRGGERERELENKLEMERRGRES